MAPPIRLLLPWALLLLIGLTVGLGSQPLRDPDEGRNAEVAREMAETNGYVLPHLNGLPYLDKPVFFFAVSALSIELLGSSELAVRSVPFAFFLATVILVGHFGRRLFGPTGGWIAALTTATAPLCIAFSRIVIMDSTLCFFVVSSIVAFYLAIEGRRRIRERRIEGPVGGDLDWRIYSSLGWAAIGVGILIKGPVALAVPLLIALPYSLWRRAAFALWHPAGLVLATVIVAPWVWAVEQELPGFLRYVLVTETVSRMASDELRRSEPFWYFGPMIFAGAFPWSAVALSFLWPRRLRLATRASRDPRPRGLRHRPEIVYLLLWIVVPLIFFSLSRGKMPQYILPLIPAVGLLVAARWSRSERPDGAALGALGWGLFGVLMLVASGFAGRFDLAPELQPHFRPTALLLGIAGVAAAIFGWYARRRVWGALIALSLPGASLLAITLSLVGAMNDERSGRVLAERIGPELEHGTELLGAREFSGSLAFYLEQTYPVFTEDCWELRSNYLRNTCDEVVEPGGQYRPGTDLDIELERCDGSRIFVMKARDEELRSRLEQTGHELLVDGGKLLAYGPRCTPPD